MHVGSGTQMEVAGLCQVMSHLTNYSLNKRSNEFVHGDETGENGTKRWR